VLRIFEAELISNLADGQTGFDEQLLGALDAEAVFILKNRKSGAL
jgi:hypothetical protein